MELFFACTSVAHCKHCNKYFQNSKNSYVFLSLMRIQRPHESSPKNCVFQFPWACSFAGMNRQRSVKRIERKGEEREKSKSKFLLTSLTGENKRWKGVRHQLRKVMDYS